MFEMEYDKQMDINFDVCWMEMYMNVYNEILFGWLWGFYHRKLYSGAAQQTKKGIIEWCMT